MCSRCEVIFNEPEYLSCILVRMKSSQNISFGGGGKGAHPGFLALPIEEPVLEVSLVPVSVHHLGSRFRVSGFGCWVSGSGVPVSGLGSRVSCFGFRDVEVKA